VHLLLNSAPLLLDLRLHWVQGGHEQCGAVCVADEQDIEDNVLLEDSKLGQGGVKKYVVLDVSTLWPRPHMIQTVQHHM